VNQVRGAHMATAGNIGAGVNAPPVTYMVNGEQYLAVAAGGNSQLTYPYGDVVAIFKLGSDIQG
jgi:glucose dehydrogenase